MDDKVTISDEALAQFSCWDSWDKTHTAFSSIARELLAYRRQAQEAPKAARGLLARDLAVLVHDKFYFGREAESVELIEADRTAQRQAGREEALAEMADNAVRLKKHYDDALESIEKRSAEVVEAANVAKRFLESEDCEKGVYQREVLAAIDKSLSALDESRKG